jgi:flagellar motility protein MotE (MotC chaperone)
MAEERFDEIASSEPSVARRKKKMGKAGFALILLLLASGAGAGLHFSGMWDARPLIWGTVPQIPYIGMPIANFFNIPEQFTLTVEQRRAFEQNERDRRLDEWERNLAEREAAVSMTLGDIINRSEQLAGLEASAMNAVPAVDIRDTSAQEEIARIRRDFATMSSRNAALILEEMPDGLSVEILQGLSSEARASILGRMDPRIAARLLSIMSVQ